MLAYDGMVPRAVQQGVIGITTEGLDRVFGFLFDAFGPKATFLAAAVVLVASALLS